MSKHKSRTVDDAYQDSILLMRQLIAVKSMSGAEEQSASLIESFLRERGVAPQRYLNNVWATGRHYNSTKPSILLNSHHDTVPPVKGWSRDPFEATTDGQRLYGLGSNDAGAALCALAAVFLMMADDEALPFNLIFAASAEEENSGPGGIRALLPQLPPIDCAIVGEPTGMAMAVAERGLLVLDCCAAGRAGHAARDGALNAIDVAMDDIAWLQRYRFRRLSPNLGSVKMTVTCIRAGSVHNVIPDRCEFVVDIRVTDAYTHEEILDVIRSAFKSDVRARSMRLRASGIADNHLFRRAARRLGLRTFGSPTLSDQALLPMPSVKIGPGESARSHGADEYIRLDEVREGLEGYAALLKALAAEVRDDPAWPGTDACTIRTISRS